MHTQSIERWQHNHVFLGDAHGRNERRTWFVVALTAAMMVAEIAAGMAFGSMALLADGWHMATHAGALSISGFAYLYARRHARSPRFTFGTGKVGDLAGYTSAIVLALIALLIAYESILRLHAPVAISFDEAIAVAAAGLIVNLLSALLLWDRHGHRHHHHHDDEAGGGAHRHSDHNLRSAYFHVLADALTSVLAIVALLAGRLFGWAWLDPVIGVVGALVILRWSAQLLRDTSAVLLDMQPDAGLARDIRRRVEAESRDRIADLHLWRVGPGHFAAILSVVTDRPVAAEHYKALLAGRPELSHVTVEVQRCGLH